MTAASSTPKSSKSSPKVSPQELKGKAFAASLTKEEQALFDHLQDRDWRLRNLYYIKDKKGKKMLFKPNWAQEIIMQGLWFFSIILKARQLGITTFFCILYLDAVLFKENQTAGIIAHKEKDAKLFFRDKVKFAWDNLPQALKDYLGPPNTDSVGELSFPNGSRIFVSTSTRGGTCQYLHISEFGKLCAQYPGKARELVTGAINSVEQGNIVTIESTAEGREGYFYDFCKQAEQDQIAGKTLSPLEFKFFFFPWWKEVTYTLAGTGVVPKEFEEYFQTLKNKHGVHLTLGQKLWYIAKKKANQDDMFREYPSTSEEAFSVSNEGAYFSNEMMKVYEQQRIRLVPWDPSLLVDVWWDLGMNDLNVLTFTQGFGNEIRFIDCYYNHGEGLGHYVNIIKQKGYTYGWHYFPHDVNVRSLDEDAKSRRETLQSLGIRNLKVIERTKDIRDDIEAIRKIFPRFFIDEKNCGAIVDALNNFKKEWDDKLGEYKNYPKHDRASHFVSTIRLLARGWNMQAVDRDAKDTTKVEDFF